MCVCSAPFIWCYFDFHPSVLGVLPAPGWDEFPTAPGPSQSLQTNFILPKAAEGGQAMAAQETLPDWWHSVRACGKSDGATGWTTSRERKSTPSPFFSLHVPGKPSSRAMEMPSPQPLGNWRPPEMCLFCPPTLLHCKADPTPRCCRTDPAWITPTTGTKRCQTQHTLPRPLLWWAQGGLGCFTPQSLRTGPF